MMIGDLIMPGEVVYTPAVPRGGSQGVFSVTTLKVNGGTLTIEVQNKNYDQNSVSADWSTVGSSETATTATTTSMHRSDLKEQVRLKLSMSSGSTDWARVFVYDPSWEE